MKSLTIIITTALLFSLGMLHPLWAADPPNDACIACHKDIDDEREPGHQVMPHIFEDVHLKAGLSCADCHGGNPKAFDDEDAAMWDDPTFVGAIEKKDQPQVCGKCHSDPDFMRQYTAHLKTDQVAQYWTSQHGHLLKEGNTKVAVCTDCHGVHGIYPVKDPRSAVYPLNVPETCSHCHSDADYMKGFNIPTDQYEKFKISVHGQALLEKRDLAAPACNDCHGNHGAMPPNVASIVDICGTCHANNQRLFQESHLDTAFTKIGARQCVECHGNHDVEHPTENFLREATNSFVCRKCHEFHKDKATKLAAAMAGTIDTLRTTLEEVTSLVEIADNKGMEVSDLLSDLEEARKALIQTRTSIHSFNENFVRKTAQPGFKALVEVKKGALAALAQVRFRRKWLAAMTVLVFLVVVTLYLKIRQMEKRQAE